MHTFPRTFHSFLSTVRELPSVPPQSVYLLSVLTQMGTVVAGYQILPLVFSLTFSKTLLAF